MIPQEKIQAVTRGLREAFGLTEFEHISEVTGGHTPSLVFRIIVGGSPYLLKIITRKEDPTRHYASMRAAAEAGVAPRVWYANVEDNISITDFVQAQPLSRSEALVRLPALLRTLHALAPFDRAPFNTSCTFLLDNGPMLDGWLQKFRAANLLPDQQMEEFFTRYSEISGIYPFGDSEMAASHNDVFKPDNFVFDGNRVWLVDWEAAFLNDRYADLAVAANHVVTSSDEEVAYLREYFGAEPDEYQLARFHLMRQMAHLFYTMAFLYLGSSGNPVDWNGAAPSFDEFHRRMWARDVDLTDPNVKVTYGKVHWNELRQNVQQRRYRDALRILERSCRGRRGTSA